MIKTRFIFAVSFCAMIAVGAVHADTATDDAVGTAHTVYTDRTPTTGAGIAGVSYVNKAVNAAGAAAQDAENHAASAGASALAAQESAEKAAESATAANEALAGKQDTLTTSNIKGSGSVSVGISNGVITVTGTDNNTTYSTGTATASGLTKLYTGTGTATDGTMTQAALKTALDGKLSTTGKAASATTADSATKATQDASGNVITSTYATKSELSSEISTVTGAAEAVSGRVDDLENAVDNRVSYTNGTAVGSASVPVYVTKDGVATKVTSVAASLLPAATSSTKGAVITGTNITNDSGTISVATGTPSTLGVVKVGQIPSGSATSTTYATIWVE